MDLTGEYDLEADEVENEQEEEESSSSQKPVSGFDFGDGVEGEAAKLKEKVHDESELEQLTIEETISDDKRLLIIASSENLIQKQALLYLLPKYFSDPGTTAELQESTLVGVQDTLQALLLESIRFDPEYREIRLFSVSHISRPLKSVGSRKTILGILLHLMQTVARNTSYGHASEDEMEVMQDILTLTEEVIQDEKVSDSDREELVKGLHEKTLEKIKCVDSCGSRALGVRMLGLVMRCGDYYTNLQKRKPQTESELLKEVEGLCQDIDVEVRRAVCEQLPHVCRIFPIGFCGTLFPEYKELAKDEEPEVRLAALKALRGIIANLPSEQVIESVAPWFVELITTGQAASRLKALRASYGTKREYGFEKLLQFGLQVASILGPLLATMQPVAKAQLGLDDGTLSPLKSLLEEYFLLARASIPEIRYACVYNWPAVLVTLGGANYAKYLHAQFERFAADESESVRIVLAKSLHHMTQLLGKPRAAKYIAQTGILGSFLSDPAMKVRSALVSEPRGANLVEVIRSFAIADEELRAQVLSKLCRPVMEFCLPPEDQMKHDWRFRCKGLQVIVQVHDLLDAAEVNDFCLPRLLVYMCDGVEPLRTEAARTLAWLMKNNLVTSQDVRVIHDIKAQFCRSHAWNLRTLFVQFIDFTGPFLKEEFFQKYRLGETLLDLLEDKVPNVRAVVCQRMLSLVENGVINLDQAKAAIDKTNENDQDQDVKQVCAPLVESLKQLDGTELKKSIKERKAALAAPQAGSLCAAALTSSGKIAPFPSGGSGSGSGSGTSSFRFKKGILASSKVHPSSTPNSAASGSGGRSKGGQARPPSGASGTTPASPRSRTHLKH